MTFGPRTIADIAFWAYHAGMQGSWFRKIATGFWWPTNLWGALWPLGMLLLPLPFGFIFLTRVNDEPMLGWACGLIAMATQVVGWAVVMWKTAPNYGS